MQRPAVAPDARAVALGQSLVAHLRLALGTAAVDLVEPPVALRGGLDTEIYALRVSGGPPAFGAPLVLRVLRPHHEPARALREQATHDALTALGYPVPRVLLASADTAALGAPFILMERVRGRPLLDGGPVGMGPVLVDLQLRLHALDPAGVVGALGRAATLDGHLDELGRRVERAKLDGLTPLLDWLRRRRPPEAAEPVICHGDFHPQNVLVDAGVVTGVLDWPNALVADRAFDVGSTLNILRHVPIGLTSLGPALRGLVRLTRPLLAGRYLGAYRRRWPIDDARLAYYRVAAGMRALVRAGESRRRAGGVDPGGLDASPYAAALLAQARGVTGIVATLDG